MGCSSTTALLSSPLAAELGAWVLLGDGKSIMRSFTAKSWKSAFSFLNAVSDAAEESNHHPDIHLENYREVKLVLTTHAVGGLTQIDLDLAKKIDSIPVEYSPKWLRGQREYGEEEVKIVVESYGEAGLNGDFFQSRDEVMTQFAGGDGGGGGLFEDPEERDIANAKDDIVAELLRIGGLKRGVVADLGAGSGLLEDLLADHCDKLYAVELSPSFREALADRFSERTDKIKIVEPTLIDPCLSEPVDLALMVDVYHHLEYPKTYLSNLRRMMKPNAALVVIDFHRDPTVVTSRGPDWVMTHVRADQKTFTDEISSAGFVQVDEVKLAKLPENYFLVFRKKPLFYGVPGAGWSKSSP